MRRAEWYFDFVSPFSYLQLLAFDRLPRDLEIAYRPILFAALLDHWGHKGPAEIPAKRRQTYRVCQWRAERDGVAFRFPPAHPFNPLRALRLCVALGASAESVRAIFDFVFGEGRDPSDPDEWPALAERVGLSAAEAEARVSDPAVKEALRANSEAAAACGVYGVPTFAIGDEQFWGADVTDLLLDWLADPGVFERGELARVSALPVGIQRKR